VLAGAFFQDNCGDTLLPTQLGFGGGLLEILGGIISPSLNVVEVRTKASAEFATPLMSNKPRAIALAERRYLKGTFDVMGQHHTVAVARDMMQWFQL
jgi:hypothetical protein